MKLYRRRKVDAIGRGQTPPNITADGVWQYVHDPRATRDATLGAAVRKAVIEALGVFPYERPWVELREDGDLLCKEYEDDVGLVLHTIADALEAEEGSDGTNVWVLRADSVGSVGT